MTSPGADAGPELTIRQGLELRIETDVGRHAWRTTIERYDVAERRLVVVWPTEHVRLIPVRPGQSAEIELVRADDALYTADALIQSASMEEPPQLVLRLTSGWRRIQRRQALRHLVEMRPTAATRFSVEGDRMPFEAVILDLSSGGLRVQSRSELTLGDELELTFGTPSGGAQLRLLVSILRVTRVRSASGGLWDAGCQFVESSLSEREQIVQFILAQQHAVARTDSGA